MSIQVTHFHINLKSLCSYLGEPEKTRVACDDEGYYHTGDMVELRDDELILLGRERDDCKYTNAHCSLPSLSPDNR